MLNGVLYCCSLFTVVTEPKQELDFSCVDHQLPNGTIRVNVAWTVPNDSRTVESISDFIVWYEFFATKSFVDSLGSARANKVPFQVLQLSSHCCHANKNT